MIQCTSRRLLLVHGLLSRVCWWGDWEVGRSGSTDNGCCGSRGRGGALSCFRVVPCGNRGPSRGSESRKCKVESSMQFSCTYSRFTRSAQKALQRFETKTRVFLGETEEKSVFPIYVKPLIFTYLTPLKGKGIPTAKKRNFFLKMKS